MLSRVEPVSFQLLRIAREKTSSKRRAGRFFRQFSVFLAVFSRAVLSNPYLTFASFPGCQAVSNSYDQAGNLVQIVDGVGNVPRRSYDAAGHVVTESVYQPD